MIVEHVLFKDPTYPANHDYYTSEMTKQEVKQKTPGLPKHSSHYDIVSLDVSKSILPQSFSKKASLAPTLNR